MSLNDILPKLSSLSGDELDRLMVRIKAMRSLVGSNGSNGIHKASHSDREDDTDFGLILRCAAETAKSLGAEDSAYFQLRDSARKSPAFREKMPGVLAFFEKACPQRSERHALVSLSMRLLFQNMVELGFPVNARTVLAHIDRLPTVLNKSFPGYAQAGLLHWIVKTKRAPDPGLRHCGRSGRQAR